MKKTMFYLIIAVVSGFTGHADSTPAPAPQMTTLCYLQQYNRCMQVSQPPTPNQSSKCQEIAMNACGFPSI